MQPSVNRQLNPEKLAIIIPEILADAALLTKATVNSMRDQTVRKIEELAENERRRISSLIVKSIIALPLVIIATLFAAAAAVEFLADWYPAPLSAIYGGSALLFFLLATVVLLIPVTIPKRKESLK
jgi:hypothetical protein